MAEKRYLDLGRVRVSYSRVSPRAVAPSYCPNCGARLVEP